LANRLRKLWKIYFGENEKRRRRPWECGRWSRTRVISADEAGGSIRQQNLTFDKHPEEVGQVEVMQEDDDHARAFVGLADVDLSEEKQFFSSWPSSRYATR